MPDDDNEHGLRLNLGAGNANLVGFMNLDIKRGQSAYPLAFGDGIVDEIRASHLLEHFPIGQVQDVLTDWVRALKPGGALALAVPDLDRIMQLRDDRLWPLYLMCGQSDDDDYHKSVFTEPLLRAVMKHVGLVDIETWNGDQDTSAHPCSLNLRGIKGTPEQIEAERNKPKPVKFNGKVAALMSIPRLGWNDHWGCTFDALRVHRIPLHRYSGVFWGQCLTRGLQACMEAGVDWALCLDYDTMFTAQHVNALLMTVAQWPEIDAVCAMQTRRNVAKAIGGMIGHDGPSQTESDGLTPIQLATAHFGLTLIRVAALNDLEKPWFLANPDPSGGWNDGREDEDIAFWRRWAAAGKTLYAAPFVRVGHLEVVVSDLDERMQVRRRYVREWLRDNYADRYSDQRSDEASMPPEIEPLVVSGNERPSLTLPPVVWADSERDIA